MHADSGPDGYTSNFNRQLGNAVRGFVGDANLAAAKDWHINLGVGAVAVGIGLGGYYVVTGLGLTGGAFSLSTTFLGVNIAQLGIGIGGATLGGGTWDQVAWDAVSVVVSVGADRFTGNARGWAILADMGINFWQASSDGQAAVAAFGRGDNLEGTFRLISAVTSGFVAVGRNIQFRNEFDVTPIDFRKMYAVPPPPFQPRSFANTLPERLDDELADAIRVGARPISPSDPGFADAVNEGRIKFVVTESGDLLVSPHTVKGVEISHAVLANGHRVIAAGEADVAGAAGEFVGIAIAPHSGHYLPTDASLEIAKDAFAKAGIVFN